MRLLIEAIEWEVRYPVHVEPIGRIRRQRDGFDAELADEPLGRFDSGDAAVEAVWGRFVEAAQVRHQAASRTHGGDDRHHRGQAVASSLATTTPRRP